MAEVEAEEEKRSCVGEVEPLELACKQSEKAEESPAVGLDNQKLADIEQVDEVTAAGVTKRDLQSYRNLPGLLSPHAAAHVAKDGDVDDDDDDNNNKAAPGTTSTSIIATTESTSSSPEAKRPKLTSIGSPGQQQQQQHHQQQQLQYQVPDPCASPDSGKRKRIQHDYRRLSSSGYMDDYVGGKERRFSSTSDSDMSSSPASPKSKGSASSPKSKVNTSSKVKMLKRSPNTSDSSVNGLPSNKGKKKNYT